AAAVATTNVPIHPQFGDPIKVEMSDDGGRIAVAYHDSTGLGTVTIYDTAGGSGITAIQTTNAVNSGMKDMDLSGDGDTVVLAGHVDDFIVTVSGGGIVYTDHSNTFPTEARDTSADGKTWVRGGMQAAAFRDSGSGYQSLFQYTDPTQAVVMFHAAAVSKDGRTFVAAGYDPTNMPQLLVYCFDLAQPTGQPLWKYSAPATGTLECLATEADVADDGERIVVSCYGDGSG